MEHLPGKTSPEKVLRLSPTERAWLAKHRKFRLGIRPGLAAF